MYLLFWTVHSYNFCLLKLVLETFLRVVCVFDIGLQVVRVFPHQLGRHVDVLVKFNKFLELFSFHTPFMTCPE